MGKGVRKYLYGKQLRVLDDLFSGEMSEKEMLERHKVKRRTYEEWYEEELFAKEFKRRVNFLNRQAELILARYKSLAAAKLVSLTDSEREETARRACLDIISLKGQDDGKGRADGEADKEELSEEKANAILSALAEIEK